MVDVILVDENDLVLGSMEKLEAHQKGLLHRCFSIFVFNSKGELLLQQRALDKYHCGGLWSNTCCSHQEPNVDEQTTLHRRLKEEMGFDTPLKKVFTFTYRAEFDNGLVEHEVDHVFLGEYEGEFTPNPEEVASTRWVDPLNLPELSYTPWFLKVVNRVVQERKRLKQEAHS